MKAVLLSSHFTEAAEALRSTVPYGGTGLPTVLLALINWTSAGRQALLEAHPTSSLMPILPIVLGGSPILVPLYRS